MKLQSLIVSIILLLGIVISDAQIEPAPTLPTQIEDIDALSISGPGLDIPAATRLQALTLFGRGIPNDVLWNALNNEIVIPARDGLWIYDADNIQATPRYAAIPTRPTDGNRSTLSYHQTSPTTLTAYDLFTGQQAFTASFEIDALPIRTVTPNGERIIGGRHVWATPWMSLRLWDTVEQQMIEMTPVDLAGGYNRTPLVTSDSKKLIILAADTIRIFDLEDGTLITEYTSQISETWQPADMYLHPDNTMLILTREGDPLEIWDITSGDRQFVSNPHDSIITEFTFSANETVIATRDQTGKVVIWNQNFQPTSTFELNQDFGHIALSPGGDQLAAVSVDHRLKIVQSDDGTTIDVIEPQTAALSNVSLHYQNVVSTMGDQLLIRNLNYLEYDLPIQQIPLVDHPSLMMPMSFITRNRVSMAIYSIVDGSLHAVTISSLVPPLPDDYEPISIHTALPDAHDSGTNIRHITEFALSENALALLGNDVRDAWNGDTFITLDQAHQLVVWNLRTEYPSDDDNSTPEYLFTPIAQYELFTDQEIEVHHIATQGDYLAAATSDGVYVWDMGQTALDDNASLARHLRDAMHPNVNQLNWFDETRLVYGGDSRVLNIVDMTDSSYIVQIPSSLADIRELLVTESLVFVAGCAEESIRSIPGPPRIIVSCENYGFEVFYTNYVPDNGNLNLASPLVFSAVDRSDSIENFFLYGQYNRLVLIDHARGSIEVWGIPTMHLDE